jgi:hypothetical protein
VSQPTPPAETPPRDDPVLRNSLREARAAALIWGATTAAVCLTCFLLGDLSVVQPADPTTVPTTFGIPTWFVLGVLVPWAASSAAMWWFAGGFMAEDDLGRDHTPELDADIREEARAHHG